jgi:hypothetical protein
VNLALPSLTSTRATISSIHRRTSGSSTRALGSPRPSLWSSLRRARSPPTKRRRAVSDASNAIASASDRKCEARPLPTARRTCRGCSLRGVFRLRGGTNGGTSCPHWPEGVAGEIDPTHRRSPERTHRTYLTARSCPRGSRVASSVGVARRSGVALPLCMESDGGLPSGRGALRVASRSLSRSSAPDRAAGARQGGHPTACASARW